MKKVTTLVVVVLLCGFAQLKAQWVTFPVVFHVCYTNANQNLPDSVLQHQLDVLNEDFNAANADLWKVPPVWQPIIGNMNINFVFASLDPQGNPTNGIERRQFAGSNVHYFAQGGLDAWPDTSYLNIWVWSMPNGMLGYASFPGAPGINGLDLHYRVVGRGSYAQAPYDHGRVATHELGHWLGLYHTWSNSMLCPDADSVADTPECRYETYGGHDPFSVVTDFCQPNAPGKMWMNFLDFTNDTSMYMFTQGQCARMTNVINTMRMGFLTPDGIDGVAEHSAASRYTVFPSPSTDGFFTINRSDAVTSATVEVHDVQGRLLGAPQLFSSGMTSMSIDLSAYAEGVYTIVIRGNAVETKRVVIARQ